MANSALNKLKSKVKSKTLVGKQKNLDVNKNGKLDKEDFKILRGNKMAKGGETKDFINWDKIIGKKVNGWEATDNNGISIGWENEDSEYFFYATPGWENEKKLPIQIVGDNGDFSIGMYSKNSNASYDLKEYLKEVKNIIDIIKSKKTISESDFKDKFSGVKKLYEKGGYMAKGGELSEVKMIKKLEKRFKGKDLWEDEIMDEYEVKMFDYREDEEMEKWKRKNREKNYIVPFDSQDDSYIFILVPKDKMEKGGYMANGGSIPNNYKGKKPEQVWNEWTIEQKRHFLEDHEHQLRKAGADTLTLLRSSKKSYDDLPLYVGDALIEHVTTGQYEMGGETYDKALFKKELTEFKKHIKDGYGWISPEYVRETWENMNFKTNINNVNSSATQDLYKDLIESNMLWFPEEGDDDEKGERVKTFKDLYGWNYGENVEYAKGGTLAQENNDMLQSTITEMKHHVDELKSVVSKNTEVEPWVIAKAERASTDLSDITHYLEGEKKKGLEMPFEKGGYMADGGIAQSKQELLSELGKTLEKANELMMEIFPKTQEEFDKLPWYTRENLVACRKGIWDAMSNRFMSTFEKGGYMADGGEVSLKVKELQTNLSKKINKSLEELQVLGQYYDVRSDSFKNLTKAYNFLNQSALYILGTYDKDLKTKEEMEKNGYMAKGGEVNEREEYLQKLEKLETKISRIKNNVIKNYVLTGIEKKAMSDIFDDILDDVNDISYEISMYMERNTMEKGGYMAEGGEIENQYENLTPKEIWSMWTEKQKMHFIRDHKHEFPEIMDSTFILAKKDFGKLPARVQIAVEFHTEDGEYAMGGRLSSSATERMEGLVPVGMMREFQKTGMVLRKYLKHDGFNDKDVTKYLCSKISNEYAKGGEIERRNNKYEIINIVNELNSMISTNSNIETDKKVFILKRFENILRQVNKANEGLEEHEDVRKLYVYIESASENVDEIKQEVISSSNELNLETDYIVKKLDELYDYIDYMGFNIEMENKD